MGQRAYKIILGAPLRAIDITEGKFNTYSDQLRDLLRSLRSFPIQEDYTNVPILDGEDWKRKYIKFNESIHSRLNTKIKDSVWKDIDAIFETFLNNRENFTFKPTLIHDDLSSDHILHDKTTGLITGIIDWGDSVFGDPAFDLTGLFVDYSPSLCDSILHGLSQSESMLLRVKFYIKLIPFYKVLYGLDIGDRKNLEDGLRLITKNFKNS